MLVLRIYYSYKLISRLSQGRVGIEIESNVRHKAPIKAAHGTLSATKESG